jgi:hypothetical protein
LATNEQISGEVRCGPLDEALPQIVRLEQRLDLPPQGFVAAASPREEVGAFVRSALQRGVK